MPLVTITINTDTHKVVPREPTQCMIDNAQTQDGEPNIPDVPIMRIYRSMLSAAPEFEGEKND